MYPFNNPALWLSTDRTGRSMAIEAATHQNTPFSDAGELVFTSTDPCERCSIPLDWISPLACQWLDVTSTIYAEAQMLLLAGLVHEWLATYLDKGKCGLLPTKKLLEKRASLKHRIEVFIPLRGTSNIEEEAMYECCRWASLILLAVEKFKVPIHVAAKHVQIQPRLVRRLRMTDLSNLWGIRKGLLFWVAALCHFATAGQCFPLIFTTLLARLAQDIAMSDCYSEIAIKPLKRLRQFEILCCRL
jgi:hypothetical protein